MHRDNLDRAPVERKNFFNIDRRLLVGGAEGGEDDAIVGFLQVLQEQRHLLTENDRDNIDGPGGIESNGQRGRIE